MDKNIQTKAYDEFLGLLIETYDIEFRAILSQPYLYGDDADGNRGRYVQDIEEVYISDATFTEVVRVKTENDSQKNPMDGYQFIKHSIDIEQFFTDKFSVELVGDLINYAEVNELYECDE